MTLRITVPTNPELAASCHEQGQWNEPLPRNASTEIVRARLRDQAAGKQRDCASRLSAAGPEAWPE